MHHTHSNIFTIQASPPIFLGTTRICDRNCSPWTRPEHLPAGPPVPHHHHRCNRLHNNWVPILDKSDASYNVGRLWIFKEREKAAKFIPFYLIFLSYCRNCLYGLMFVLSDAQGYCNVEKGGLMKLIGSLNNVQWTSGSPVKQLAFLSRVKEFVFKPLEFWKQTSPQAKRHKPSLLFTSLTI